MSLHWLALAYWFQRPLQIFIVSWWRYHFTKTHCKDTTLSGTWCNKASTRIIEETPWPGLEIPVIFDSRVFSIAAFAPLSQRNRLKSQRPRYLKRNVPISRETWDSRVVNECTYDNFETPSVIVLSRIRITYPFSSRLICWSEVLRESLTKRPLIAYP